MDTGQRSMVKGLNVSNIHYTDCAFFSASATLSLSIRQAGFCLKQEE